MTLSLPTYLCRISTRESAAVTHYHYIWCLFVWTQALFAQVVYNASKSKMCILLFQTQRSVLFSTCFIIHFYSLFSHLLKFMYQEWWFGSKKRPPCYTPCSNVTLLVNVLLILIGFEYTHVKHYFSFLSPFHIV